MSEAKNGDTVKVHYTGKLEDGTVFDSSMNDEPLEFTIGEGDLIPGFEQAVIGMAPGESKIEKIMSDQAYGPRLDEMVMEVEREFMPPNFVPEVGQQLQVRQSDGEVIPVVIIDVSDASVTLDANHPLAGMDLIFEIELLEIA
jgi:peptidylprolyl isomerase